MSEQGSSSGAAWNPIEAEGSRYYCHTCEAEFDNVARRNEEVLCQNCNNGFVELIETPLSPPGSEGFANLSGPPSQDSGDDDDRQFLTSIIQEAFQRGMGLPIQVGPAAADPRLRARPGADVHRFNATIRNAGQPLEHILSDLFYGMGAAGFGAAEGNSPLVFLGNPGDYAWGREGLDAIVTQLLNQMDGSGPPPLPTDKIKQIPVAHITKAQIDSNLQCSVCWEPFSLNEPVRRLPCDHFYHTPCIEPWLALHGTCPICRQTLHVGDAASAAPASTGLGAAMGLASGLAGGNLAAAGGLNFGNLASVLLGGGRAPTSRSTTATPASQSDPSASNATSDASSSASNPPGRRFFDMDFD